LDIRRSVTAREVYRRKLLGTPALHELIDVMRVTLAGNGEGLAAPQIAVPISLFVVEDTKIG